MSGAYQSTNYSVETARTNTHQHVTASGPSSTDQGFSHPIYRFLSRNECVDGWFLHYSWIIVPLWPLSVLKPPTELHCPCISVCSFVSLTAVQGCTVQLWAAHSHQYQKSGIFSVHLHWSYSTLKPIQYTRLYNAFRGAHIDRVFLDVCWIDTNDIYQLNRLALQLLFVSLVYQERLQFDTWKNRQNFRLPLYTW